MPNEKFEAWLRRTTTTAIDTEINCQLGVYAIKKHALHALDERFRRFADFVDVFGPPNQEVRIQCAEVRNTTRRSWLRLVGRRHDVQHWDADRDRRVEMARVHSNYVSSESIWVAQVFEPTRRYFFPDESTKFHYIGPPNEVYAVLACYYDAAVDASALYDEDYFVSSIDSDAELEEEEIDFDDDEDDDDDPEREADLAAAQYADEEGDDDAMRKLKAKAREKAREEARKEAIKRANDKKLDAKDRATAAAAVVAVEADKKQEARDNAARDKEERTTETVTKKRRAWFSRKSRRKSSGKQKEEVKVVVRTLKEIVVLRSPPAVHVYNVIEYGRRFYRTLVYTSDAARSMHCDGGATLFASAKTAADAAADSFAAIACGDASRPAPPAPSLVITRNLHASLGVQTYVPKRMLSGLLPAVLVRSYVFWQNEDDSLVGYPGGASNAFEDDQQLTEKGAASLLRIRIVPFGKDADKRGMGHAFAMALIVRVPLLPPADSATKRDGAVRVATDAQFDSKSIEDILGLGVVDTSRPSQTLLNALFAPKTSSLHAIGELFAVLDDLSHVLVWCDGEVKSGADSPNPRYIELPRVALSFEVDTNGTIWSKDHPGLKVSQERADSPAVRDLLRGIPHALVLEDADGELSAMVPATAKPIRKDEVESASSVAQLAATSGMLLDRRDDEWLGNLAGLDVRHYLYPIHSSLAFMSTPTLASALYLFCVRLLSRRYVDAFRLAESCVADTPLSPDELQLWNRISALAIDDDPEAIAARLRLALVTQAVHDIMIPSWNVRADCRAYFARRDRVHASCRLRPEEELIAIESFAELGIGENADNEQYECSWALLNRRNLLRLGLRPGAPTEYVTGAENSAWSVSLHYPVHRPEGYNPDVISRIINLDQKSVWSNFTTINYSRPEAETLHGLPAARRLCAALDHGLEVSGGKDSLGFLFLYELFTGTLRFSVRPEDSSYLLASYLTCFLKDVGAPGSFAAKLLGILEVACAAPFLVPNMPKFDDNRKFKLTTIVAGQNVAQSLLKSVSSYLSSKRAEVTRLPRYQSLRPPAVVRVIRLDKLADIERSWRAPGRSVDHANASRAVHSSGDMDPSKIGLANKTPLASAAEMCMKLSDEQVSACGGQPLGKSLDLNQLVDDVPAATSGDARVSTSLPFDVSKHPASKSHVALRMIERLSKDVAEYAQHEKVRKKQMMRGMTNDREIDQLVSSANPEASQRGIKSLRQKLSTLRDHDVEFARAAVNGAVEAANDGGAGVPGAIWKLSRRAGVEASAWFELIVEQLLSSKGDVELNELNPRLGPRGVAVVRELTCRALLAGSRAAQLSRAVGAAGGLEFALARASSRKGTLNAKDRAEVALRSSVLAEQLSARRHYVRPGSAQDRAIFHFDPRFLVFEFVHNIVLRAPQVTLVTSFAESAAGGESHCEQMIMGGGKTCVSQRF